LMTILKTKNLSTVLYLKSGNCLNGLKSSVLKLRHYLDHHYLNVLKSSNLKSRHYLKNIYQS
ncbi:hypothetical protein, partial [uncultured Gammaproteobacteria bacterium]